MRTGAPMERLHIDPTGPFPRYEGTDMTYICTCVCAFTKYAVAIPLPDKSAVTVARAIIENVILKLGCCDVIVTDNGKEFENTVQGTMPRLRDSQSAHDVLQQPI